MQKEKDTLVSPLCTQIKSHCGNYFLAGNDHFAVNYGLVSSYNIML